MPKPPFPGYEVMEWADHWTAVHPDLPPYVWKDGKWQKIISSTWVDPEPLRV